MYLAVRGKATMTGDPLRTSSEHLPTSSEPQGLPTLVADDMPETPPTETIFPDEEESFAGTPTERMMLLPGYELQGLLGRGATSVVYKARHSNLRRLVALKMISGGSALPEQLMRFRIEAETVAKLQHPNIVQIYEVGVYESCVYLALEYVEGKTVADNYGGQAIPPREAAFLVEALARGVQHAHERGVVHRDLKPANVLLTKDGVPKITDFGLAKHIGSESLPNVPLGVLGTPCYMAPEQASVEKNAECAITVAVDIYALGAILFELLTGRPPFVGSDIRETLLQVVTEKPPSPRSLRPEVPVALARICLKCLEKVPTSRYPTAAALAADLRGFLYDGPILARPRRLRVRILRWSRHHPFWSALFVGLMGLWLAVVIAALSFAQQSREEARQAQRELEESQKRHAAWQTKIRQLFDYNLTLQQRPDDLETLWKRAQLLFELRERQLARADFQELLRRLPASDPRRAEIERMIRRSQGISLGTLNPQP
jgi:eukaryotic-like serine/threonine-protein kinase